MEIFIDILGSLLNWTIFWVNSKINYLSSQYIIRNCTVWTTLFLLSVFSALKGTHIYMYILFVLVFCGEIYPNTQHKLDKGQYRNMFEVLLNFQIFWGIFREIPDIFGGNLSDCDKILLG